MILTELPDLPPLPETRYNKAFREAFYEQWGKGNWIVCGWAHRAEYTRLPPDALLQDGERRHRALLRRRPPDHRHRQHLPGAERGPRVLEHPRIAAPRVLVFDLRAPGPRGRSRARRAAVTAARRSITVPSPARRRSSSRRTCACTIIASRPFCATSATTSRPGSATKPGSRSSTCSWSRACSPRSARGRGSPSG